MIVNKKIFTQQIKALTDSKLSRKKRKQQIKQTETKKINNTLKLRYTTYSPCSVANKHMSVFFQYMSILNINNII